MRGKTVAVVVCMTALAVPAMAVAGVRPPGHTSYTGNGSSTATTKGAKGSVAKKVDIGVGIYGCGNQVPFSIEGLKISKDGKYTFDGKAENFIGDKYRLIIKGEFKSAAKLVEKATIKKGSCKKSMKITLKA